MLKAIRLENFATFKEARVELPQGLTLISGESGSGKSSFIEALFWGLGLTNQRGEKNSLVELTFILNEEDLTLTRLGNSFFISRKKVSKKFFKEESQDLITFAQQESRMTFSPKGDFLNLVDRRLPEQKKIRELFLTIKKLEGDKAALEILNPDDLDYLSAAVTELTAANLQGSDETKIILEKRQQATLLRSDEALDKASDILQKKGLINQISALARVLESEENLEELQRRVTSLLEEFRDLDAVIASKRTNNNQEVILDKLEERLIEIRTLARKYRVNPDNLLDFFEKTKIQLSQIEEIDLNKKKLELDIKRTREAFLKEAEVLNQLRLPIIEEINSAIKQHLKDLLMEGIKVELQLEPAIFSEKGNQNLKLQIGDEGKRLLSGGEISRLLLAIKIASNHLDKIMVFDEIDLGIGGATAHQVGKKLANLGRVGQVLVITHQPQVAAYGTNHLLIEKTNDISNLKILSQEGKVQEIARMISGDLITKESLQAAAKLIEAAI